MEFEESVLRSGRPWRRTPAIAVRRRKGPVCSSASVVSDDNRSGRNANAGASPNSSADGLFSCSICFDTAKEPVVTSCGHLFCWPCIYLWVHRHSLSRDCPVCKAVVEIGEASANVTPIYGFENVEISSGNHDLEVPPRPSGKRSAGSQNALISDMFREMASYQEQIESLDQTRAAIDRVWTNLGTVEVLLREVTMSTARLDRRSAELTVGISIARRMGDGGDGIYRRTRRRLADS